MQHESVISKTTPVRVKNSNKTLRRVGWAVMTILAVGIAVVSLRFFLLPMNKATVPDFGPRFATHAIPFFAHISGGIVALVLGPVQFWLASRPRLLSRHRYIGRVYLIAILVGGCGGLYMATIAFGGLPARLGFGMLALIWLTTAGLAFATIRKGNVERHREWMLRNYALTFGAVTLRLWLPLFDHLVPFEQAYVAVSWFAWVPNLLLVDAYIEFSRRRLSSKAI